MSEIYKTELVRNNKLLTEYHTSLEAAIKHLSREAMNDWIQGLPLKGKPPQDRLDIMLDKLPDLNKKLEEAQTLPKQYVEI